MISFSQLGKVLYNEGVEGAGRFSFAYKEPLLVERPRPSTRPRQTTDSGSLYGAPMIGIYKITSPSGGVYIGQSWDIKRRWNSYANANGYRNQPHLAASFSKYGLHDHSFEVLVAFPDDCLQEDLDSCEDFYIELYKAAGCNMLNCNGGGRRGKQSEETVRKRIEKTRGQKRTAEQRENMSRAMMGRPYHGKNDGLVRTEENRRKISESLKARTDNKGEQHNMAKLTKEQVLQIRSLYKPRAYSSRRLAKEFGISKSNVLDIVNHHIWKDI